MQLSGTIERGENQSDILLLDFFHLWQLSATESYLKPGDQHDPTLDALAEDLAQGARAQVQ